MPLETIPRPDPTPTPFDEPEVEVLRGIEVPKMSPRRQHALLQGELWLLLRHWAGAHGDAGTEWRMRLSGASKNLETTLVPDVAYLASVDAAKLTDEELEEPPARSHDCGGDTFSRRPFAQRRHEDPHVSRSRFPARTRR